MTDRTPSKEELEGFRAATESLKLYRRADLNDPEHGTSLIEELYVDPLPEDDVLKTVLRPHTTLLSGGKALISRQFFSDFNTNCVRRQTGRQHIWTLRLYMNQPNLMRR